MTVTKWPYETFDVYYSYLNLHSSYLGMHGLYLNIHSLYLNIQVVPYRSYGTELSVSYYFHGMVLLASSGPFFTRVFSILVVIL